MSLDNGTTAQLITGTAAAAVTITAVPTEHMAVLGIAADTLLAACAGALFGLAYTKPETWQRFMALPDGTLGERVLCATLRGAGLLFTLACNALLAGWCVEILPHLPGMTWTAKITPQPFAGVLAFAGQFTIPKAIRAIEEWRAPWSRQP